MKSGKIFFITVFFILLPALLLTAFGAEKIYYRKSDNLFVLSETGLVLRSAPDKNAPKVTLAPYGKQVTISEENRGDKFFEVNGIKGYWVKAVYDGKEGYVFDGFLSKHPVPDRCSENCENFKIIELYTDKKLKLKGKEKRTEDDSYIYVKKEYTNGFSIKRKEGQPGLPAFEIIFTMQDVRIAEAFLILKTMGFNNLKGKIFPVANAAGKVRMLNMQWNETVEIKKDNDDIVNIKIFDESVDEMGIGMETMTMELSSQKNCVIVKFSSGGS